MKKVFLILFTLTCLSLGGCSKTPQGDTAFINEINTFCTNISDIDSAINEITNITGDEEGLKEATNDLLYYLDMLDDQFKKFSNIDFPTEYDSLESLADEASEYMTEAVRSYRLAYEGDYSESMEDYAANNYSRAYKRVQYIFTTMNETE